MFFLILLSSPFHLKHSFIMTIYFHPQLTSFFHLLQNSPMYLTNSPIKTKYSSQPILYHKCQYYTTINNKPNPDTHHPPPYLLQIYNYLYFLCSVISTTCGWFTAPYKSIFPCRNFPLTILTLVPLLVLSQYHLITLFSYVHTPPFLW